MFTFYTQPDTGEYFLLLSFLYILRFFFLWRKNKLQSCDVSGYEQIPSPTDKLENVAFFCAHWSLSSTIPFVSLQPFTQAECWYRILADARNVPTCSGRGCVESMCMRLYRDTEKGRDKAGQEENACHILRTDNADKSGSKSHKDGYS